jgi:hypothetical protein
MKITKNKTPIYPAIALLSMKPKECSSVYNRDTCASMFMVMLFTIANKWNQPKCPSTDEWMKEMC